MPPDKNVPFVAVFSRDAKVPRKRKKITLQHSLKRFGILITVVWPKPGLASYVKEIALS